MGSNSSSMAAWPRFEPSKPNAAGVGHSRKRKMLGKLNLQEWPRIGEFWVSAAVAGCIQVVCARPTFSVPNAA